MQQASLADTRVSVAAEVARVEQLASAATLLMGEGAEGRPVVLARGVPAAWRRESARAADLLRPIAEDLFR